MDHVAGLAEVVFEVLPRDAPGEVVDVEAVGGDLDDFLLVVAAAGAAAVVAAVRVVAAGASAASAGWAVAHALVFCRVIDRADCQRWLRGRVTGTRSGRVDAVGARRVHAGVA